jgi:hypothetical protein
LAEDLVVLLSIPPDQVRLDPRFSNAFMNSE